jgi:UPF0716 protein FxsA
MAPVLFVALLVVPIAELWVIVRVAQGVGIPSTLGLLVLVSIAGAWLLKQQGLATWARLQRTLRSGRMPTREVADGALILLGGALLLTPGFITDAVGLVLLVPPTRALVKAALAPALGRYARRRWGARAGVVETVATDSNRDGGRGRRQAPPPELEPRSGEGGSPGRG